MYCVSIDLGWLLLSALLAAVRNAKGGIAVVHHDMIRKTKPMAWEASYGLRKLRCLLFLATA
jgi:hypothetical protein